MFASACQTVPGVGLVTQGPVEVVVRHCPARAALERPLALQLEVRNLLPRRVQLRLQWRKEKMGPILPLHATSTVQGAPISFFLYFLSISHRADCCVVFDEC